MKSLSRQLMRAWFGQREILSNISSSSSVIKKPWPRSASTKSLVLKDLTKKVEAFGKIIVNVPFDVEIKPTNPHEYSNTSTMIVNIQSNNNKLSKDELNNDSIKVNINSDVCEIQAGEDDKIPHGIYCLIQAPPRYDVEVKTTGEGNVNISGMVSDSINIQTEFGNITGSKLQGQTISFSSSEGGSIKLKNNVQGNIEINTAKDGSIDADKCMGTKLDVSTEDGDVIIGSNYCEMATFTTANGHLNLNNLHMDSTIDISGNGTLNISCLDGSLKANLGDGDASVQIARITGDSEIKTSGNVTLRVPDSSDTQLILESKKLDIDEKINGKYLEDKNTFISGKNGFKFNVKTDKTVIVKQSSWMDCLKSQKNVAS